MFLSRCVQKKRTARKVRSGNPPSPPVINVGVDLVWGIVLWNFGAFFLQHLQGVCSRLPNIEHGGSRGLPGGFQSFSGAFFLHEPVPKKLVFFLAHLTGILEKTPERGKEKSAEEKRGEQRRGEERRGEERTGEERRGEQRRGEEGRGEKRSEQGKRGDERPSSNGEEK